MGRGYLYLLVVCLLLSYRVFSIELLANYKYWKSVSDQLSYDYSGNSKHGMLTYDYIVTDRGLSPNIYHFPSFMLYNNPGLADYTLSFWMLNTSSGRIWLSVWDDSTRNFAIYYNFNTDPILVEMKIEQISASLKTTTLETFSGWNLHTMRVYLDSSNPGRYNFHLYRNLIHLHTNYIESDAIPTQFDCHLGCRSVNTASSPILYEVWVHIGLSHISELSSLLSIYNCPASLTTVCLPTHPSNMNKLGQLCPSECTSNNLSCDISLSCIPKNKSECQYELYDLETSKCLFYCPNNSCVCPPRITDWRQSYSSFSCSCNLGYNKISDNPPACISKRCLSYSKIGYEYICDSTESGYTLDALEDCCICKSDITQVSLNPIICINTSVCMLYTISGEDYTCSSCAEGFVIDSMGKCNKCDSKYVNVLDNPFTCILEIDNCASYEKEGDEWKCKECMHGYKRIESESILCKREIEHCISYDLYSQESNCSLCENGYAVGLDYECSICEQGYISISIDPLVCEIEFQHCIHHSSAEGMLECLECESKYVVIQSECLPEIPFCKNYDIIGDQYVCYECFAGYTYSEGKCVPETVYDYQDIDSSDEEEVENITQAQIDRAEIIDSSNSVAINLALASTSLSSLISMDPKTLILFMNTIQLISLIRYLYINLPFEISKQQSSMNDFMRKTNILSNFKIKDRDLDEYIRFELDDKYSYLATSIYNILGLMIVMTLNIIIYLCCKYCKGKVKLIAARLLRYFKYTIYIQLYTTTYLNIIDASLSKLTNVMYN